MTGFKVSNWRRCGALLTVLVLLGACAATDQGANRAQFTAGVDAFDVGDYAAARSAWLPLAQGGDPAAQRNMGHLYRLGYGVERDPINAVAWYSRAARAGLRRAQANLGQMYFAGDGIDRDFVEARRWFRDAASRGHVIAQYMLGRMYEHGLGDVRDIERARNWYRAAAAAGYAPAKARLVALLAEEAAAITLAPWSGQTDPPTKLPLPELPPFAPPLDATRTVRAPAQEGAESWWRDLFSGPRTPVEAVLDGPPRAAARRRPPPQPEPGTLDRIWEFLLDPGGGAESEESV